ncbi:unnamed protein product [Closterium sp. NIES-65]|nr:unnamed protein product [Closterium sp. NIES-65]
MEVARTSMIHAAAPHFLWPFVVEYAAHQLNLWPRVSLPTSSTLPWTGEVGDASVFRVWDCRAFVRDTSADKLSSCAIPCVFLGFPPDAPGWHFYHPTSCCIQPSQNVTFDESIPFYHLFPYRTVPLPLLLLFLAPGPPPVDPLPPQGPAPSCVSQVDPLPLVEPVKPGGAELASAEPGSAEPEHAEPGGAEPVGLEPRSAASERAELGGAEPVGAEPIGAEFLGAEPRGPASTVREPLSPQQLREWYAWRTRLRIRAVGAGGTTAGGAGTRGTGAAGAGGAGGASTAGPGGARAGGAGAVGAGGATVAGGAGGVGAAGPGGARAGGTGAARAGGGGAAGGAGGARAAGPGGARTGGTGTARAGSGAASLEGACTGGTGAAKSGGAASTGAGGAGAVGTGTGGAVRPQPYFTLSLKLFRAASPAVTRLLAIVITNPSFESTAAFALVAELIDFDATCRLDYAASLLAASESDAPDIPTPRSYAEAITGPYSSQWQKAMDAEMASWKSTGTYVDVVPPSEVNIVDGMWIFRANRPPGSPPVFKARYVAIRSSRRHEVDFFQTFFPTLKMTTLQVLLHVAAQHDYELHSLDFRTAFL